MNPRRMIENNGRVCVRCAMRRRGVILVAIMVICVLASMVAASLLFRVSAETSAATATIYGEQAYQAAMSGLQTVLAVMSPPPDETGADAAGATAVPPNVNAGALAAIDDPTIWLDNPDLLRNRLVVDDGANRWYFTVYSLNASDRDNVRYGLTDEGGKININTADEETLLGLPGMTPELVDALMDYRDQDDEPRPNGAEQEYYDQLPTPYAIKNGPLGTIEELLLVKGFNASIVFGEDANLNTLLEPNEDDGDESFPPDNNDGELNTGLYGAATTSSLSLDLSGEGGAKLDMNRASASQMRNAGVPRQTAEFIEQVRNDGGRISHPSQLLDMRYTIRGRGGNQGGRGGRGRGNQGPRPGTVISSGAREGDMPAIMDALTTASGGGLRPQIGVLNINTAPAAAIAALPGIDEGLARQIAEARPNVGPEQKRTTAWLLTEGFVGGDTYKRIAPRLTTRGFQYRLRIIGFGVPCGRYRIIEAVIDLSGAQPRVTYVRDITRLGAPFPLNPEDEEL